VDGLAQQLEQGGWLTAQAWIYVESPRATAPVALPPNWQPHREGQAGEVRFALYRR
jgi:16S rRNA (guanine966-N2)-methyltransferase